MRLVNTSDLDDAARAHVLALVEQAVRVDGVAPVGEQTLLVVRHGGAGTHLLAYHDADLVGYAHLTPDEPSSAELVTAPRHRRGGVGRALLDGLLSQDPGVRVWAHGDLPAARALAAAVGLAAVRELRLMGRPLRDRSAPLPPVHLPDGFAARPFVVGRDEPAWLEVNARAFAHHPEQGGITAADLAAREAEPWFDPAGFLLVEDVADGGRLAAFHWTKVHPAGTRGEEPVGEVYVVGVDPAYQGRGLGRAVTLLGLHHLAARALSQVILYVDADNTPAVATYERLGFRVVARDVMYAGAAAGEVPR